MARAQRRTRAPAIGDGYVGPASGEQRRPYAARAIAGDVVRVGLRKDHAAARLADLQHGNVTWAQLLVVGFGRRAIAGRISRGYLHPQHHGVYRVGHTAPLPFAREMAAVLACGEFAVLSHRSAAAAWQLAPDDELEVHISVIGGRRRRRPGIRSHRSSLGPEDVSYVRRIPVTGPARTLLDLAADSPPLLLERAVEDARRRRLVTNRSLEAILERARGHRGSGALRSVLEREREPAFTRSAAEERLVELIRAAGLPPPEHNIRVGPFELDVVWREARLVVEIDGFAYHSSREAFERDRRHDATLAAAGWTVIRVTWRQLTDEPEGVIARLAAALARGA
jgi:very-short-patch-repair endonuclease